MLRDVHHHNCGNDIVNLVQSPTTTENQRFGVYRQMCKNTAWTFGLFAQVERRFRSGS